MEFMLMQCFRIRFNLRPTSSPSLLFWHRDYFRCRHWMGISWSKWNETEVCKHCFWKSHGYSFMYHYVIPQVQSDAEAHVSNLEAAGFPLDTLIFDMQWGCTPTSSCDSCTVFMIFSCHYRWHLTPDWTGYTWASLRYPNVSLMLDWMHGKDLATGANLHDAEGVQVCSWFYVMCS